MKLIQQCKLFFREGNSDKVYEIDLCKLTNGEYLVNFRYGRRGASLKEGTKTPASVNQQEAEKIFNKLEQEKRTKGYQTEEEINIPLPVLNHLDKNTLEGRILLRLQDAVENTQSFKTTWKTSRVIWKAGELGITKAAPYILKLASKGDDFQLYASIWAFIQLKTVEAIPFLKTAALQIKQKDHVRWLAYEGLFQLMEEGEDLNEIKRKCFTLLPETLQEVIKEGETDATFHFYSLQIEQKLALEGFSAFYLLSLFNPQWNKGIQAIIEQIPFIPPYFKTIRSLYKLAQIRKDYTILTLLSYRLEKEDPMYTRRASLDPDGYPTHQYINSIGEYLNIGKELRGKNSRVAFSHNTKYYFQQNSVTHLIQLGTQKDGKDYIKLAINQLLQYTEADYTAKIKQPPQQYGMYSYELRQYLFTSIEYAECSKAYLLSSILFGNDSTRMLTPKLELIHSKTYEVSDKWYYNVNNVRPYNPENKATKKESKEEKGLLSTLKNFFSKKETIVPETISQPESTLTEVSQRTELYPEHWDAYPEAYIQLLMMGKMNLIHQFAFDRLQAHANYDAIKKRFSLEDIIQLLQNPFEIPQKLGYQTLENRKQEFEKLPNYMLLLLNVSHQPTLTWASRTISFNRSFYLENAEALIALLFNNQEFLDTWIIEQLEAIRFNEATTKEIVEQTIQKLILLTDTPAHNILAKKTIQRLKIVAKDQLASLHPKIISYLLEAPLGMNALLASEIIALKAQANENIPISLCVEFIQNPLQEVRYIGLDLLQKASETDIQTHWNTVLTLLQHDTAMVVQTVLNLGLRPSLSSQLQSTWIQIVQTLISKPAFEGSHSFIINQLEAYKAHLQHLEPNYLLQVLFANYRDVQIEASLWLYAYPKTNTFTLRQIIALAESELLSVRQWVWQYYENNIERIKKEKERALSLVDSKWEDTRTFAFQFFRTQFEASDWTTETLISLVDSVRDDVMQFGKELIMRYFTEAQGHQYLIALSQHPSEVIQLYVSNLLKEYATDSPEKLEQLDFYFRSVLFRVHKGRITKERVLDFLIAEALKNEKAAHYVNGLFSYLSATSALQDKARFILALSQIQDCYPQMDSCLILNS